MKNVHEEHTGTKRGLIPLPTTPGIASTEQHGYTDFTLVSRQAFNYD